MFPYHLSYHSSIPAQLNSCEMRDFPRRPPGQEKPRGHGQRCVTRSAPLENVFRIISHMVFRIRSALRFSLNSANAGLRAFSDGTLRKPLVVEKPNTKVEIQTPARLKESILIVFFKSTIHTKHYRLIQHSSRIRQGLVLNDVLSLTHVRVYFSQSKVPSIEKGQKVVFCVRTTE